MPTKLEALQNGTEGGPIAPKLPQTAITVSLARQEIVPIVCDK